MKEESDETNIACSFHVVGCWWVGIAI